MSNLPVPPLLPFPCCYLFVILSSAYENHYGDMRTTFIQNYASHQLEKFSPYSSPKYNFLEGILGD